MRKLTQAIADEALKAVGWLLLPVFILLFITFVVCTFWVLAVHFWPVGVPLVFLLNLLGFGLGPKEVVSTLIYFIAGSIGSMVGLIALANFFDFLEKREKEREAEQPRRGKPG
jgi:uncharacterized membrane protein YuzA (DUF378 family)